MKMKRTVFVLVTGVVCLALITVAHAQNCTSICTPQPGGQQFCTTSCTPTQPLITHRYNGPSRAEQDYQQRAYEYELRRLDQENRR
jgi:hypothetical protein